MRTYAPLLCLLILIACGVSAFGQRPGSPAETVDQFYMQYMSLQIRGLPNADQSKAIDPFLSQEIKDLIAADLEKQKQFIKDRPDDKPPWIEGDLFSSLFEGATSYKIGRTSQKGSTANVDVALSYKDPSGVSNWTDTVVLTKAGSKWLIRDILYKGQWQFKTAGSLVKALK